MINFVYINKLFIFIPDSDLPVISKNILDLKLLYTQISGKIDIIMRSLGIAPQLSCSSEKLPLQLPLKSLDDIQQFNNIIINNENLKTQYVCITKNKRIDKKLHFIFVLETSIMLHWRKRL